MDELNITFSGVCTTLQGMVPGVPMRAVLPYAVNVHFGVVWVPQPDNQPPRQTAYYLMPHVATIRDGLTKDSWHKWLTGYYLTVPNAIGDPLSWAGGGYRLSEYVSDLQLDPDVALRGNAAAYFDLFHGCAWSDGSGEEMRLTRVRVQTSGTPCLRMVPMPNTRGLKTFERYIDSHELIVSNADIDPAAGPSQYDFMMNYLVRAGGIPAYLSRPVPGMTFEPRSYTVEEFGHKLKALGTVLQTRGTVSGYREIGGAISVDALPPERRIAGRQAGTSLDETGLFVQPPMNANPSCSPGSLP